MNVNSDTGEIKPVFKQEFQISIRNNNAQRASFKNPGIIYFLQESDEKHGEFAGDVSRVSANEAYWDVCDRRFVG